jgi:hypothetical protein
VVIATGDDKVSLSLADKTESTEGKFAWSVWIQQQSPLAIGLGWRTWQQWHHVGPRKMGEAIYIGRSPLLGKQGMQDTTRITLGEIDAVVYTSPENGNIECIELISDGQSDPAEIYFDGYHTVEGRAMPSRIRLVFGLENRLVIECGELQTGAETTAGGEAPSTVNGN